MDITVAIALLVIIGLATFDLWIGVANDAANFLNSAIGSQVAARRKIYLIAAAGILLGVLTSNGLMEVARKGVFDPSVFVAADGTLMLQAILAIYLGVMAADVLMLDLFNTFGLPTSTTVSIVSELVGASIAVALWMTPGGIVEAVGVINGGPVFAIYTGIFLSVLIAFLASAILMFIVRLFFGHDLATSFPKWGWLWTGTAFSCLAYFVLYKGFKNAEVVPDGVLSWIGANLILFLGGVFVVAALIGHLNSGRPRKVVGTIILVGTGALGLAFAGNDLMNFIGPSVAAAQAVFVPGIDLSGKVGTPAWVLLLAGAIMVTSLMVSRKARRVSDTELRLASHGATSQRFSNNRFTTGVVTVSVATFSVVKRLVPASMRKQVRGRVTPPEPHPDDPPYDILRASVNLVVASLLISLGTANGLPLSTTYITFTAAMGAALGDVTWTKDDADARVAGILTVFVGWAVTGVIAASGAFVMASIIALGGTTGVLAAVGLVAAGLWRLARVADPIPTPTNVPEQLPV